MRKVQSNNTVEAIRKAMNKHLNESLNAPHGENITAIYLGIHFDYDITIFAATVYGDSNEAINVNYEAPNGKIKKVIMCQTGNKRIMRKVLNDHLDLSDEKVIYIVTTLLGIDGKSVVKAVFTGDNRGYKLRHLDDADVKSVHEICNNIATPSRKEVA